MIAPLMAAFTAPLIIFLLAPPILPFSVFTALDGFFDAFLARFFSVPPFPFALIVSACRPAGGLMPRPCQLNGNQRQIFRLWQAAEKVDRADFSSGEKRPEWRASRA